VVLWLNGGPGCSSMDGFLYEHGPFQFKENKNASFILNPYAWNKLANVLYVEAPAGVGMSYSTSTSDYHTDDKTTASDNYQFLLRFFEDYSEFISNPFYISGESYAGIYVPTLVEQVLLGNKKTAQKINIQGFLVGNGVTDYDYDSYSVFPFAYYHALYPTHIFEDLVKYCGANFSSRSALCTSEKNKVFSAMGNINIYGIYNPCFANSDHTNYRKHPLANLKKSFGIDNNFNQNVPCVDASAATNYLNSPDVRRSIHAAPVSEIGLWSICSDKIKYTRQYFSLLDLYPTLLKETRACIYSGDTDAAVPYVGTQNWIRVLNLKLIKDWKTWKVNNQVAGYVTEYEKLMFVTIKGAGHMVPQDKPAEAYAFFSAFLNDKPPA